MKLVMTEAEAIAAGFTHAGTLYSIPVWVDMRCESCPNIHPKYRISEPWIWLCELMSIPVSMCMSESYFRITLKRRIGIEDRS